MLSNVFLPEAVTILKLVLVTSAKQSLTYKAFSNPFLKPSKLDDTMTLLAKIWVQSRPPKVSEWSSHILPVNFA